MKITRKFTIRGSEPELNVWMSPVFMSNAIHVRLAASEKIKTADGSKHQPYDGKLVMSVDEAFRLIADLNTAIFSAYSKAVKDSDPELR